MSLRGKKLKKFKARMSFSKAAADVESFCRKKKLLFSIPSVAKWKSRKGLIVGVSRRYRCFCTDTHTHSHTHTHTHTHTHLHAHRHTHTSTHTGTHKGISGLFVTQITQKLHQV